MRMLRFVGCALLISTANAQPAPDADAPPSAAPPAAALAPPGMTPAGPLPAPQPEIEIDNYRWQVAAADVVSVGLALSQSGTGIRLAGLTYVLGGPIIHGVHGQGGRMGASLALRVGLPIVLAFAGAELAHHGCSPTDDDCDDGTLGGAILGFGVGLVTAMVVDSAVIAGPVEIRKPTGATWAPRIAVTPRHVGLGVLGRF